MTTTQTDLRDDAVPPFESEVITGPQPTEFVAPPRSVRGSHNRLWAALVAGVREPAALFPAIALGMLAAVRLLGGLNLEVYYDAEFSAGILWPILEAPFSDWGGYSIVTNIVLGAFSLPGVVSVVAGVLVARRHPRIATGLATWPFLSIPLLALYPAGAWYGLLVITVLSIRHGWRAWIAPLGATVLIGAYLPAGWPWGYSDLPEGIDFYAGNGFWIAPALILSALVAGLIVEHRRRSSSPSSQTFISPTVLVQTVTAIMVLWWFGLPLPLTTPVEFWVQDSLRAPFDLAPPVGLAIGVVGTGSSIAAILVARTRPKLSTALAAWPILTLPLFGVFKLGWLVALVIVAAFAGFDRWWKGIPAVVLAIAAITLWTASGGAAQRGYSLSLAGQDGPLRALTYCVLAAGVYAGAVSAGIAVRARHRSVAAAATERRALATESVATERARLARDLHDVVAHHVSLVAVRAESAPFVHPGLNNDARTVLDDIAGDARSALDELRQVLAVLQRSGDGAQDGPELAPQPDACDIPQLVEQARAAGQDVTIEGTCEGIPAAQGYVLYRAAQEALTNARRHAPGTRAEVTLMQNAAVVGLCVINPTPDGTRPSTLTEGRGLIGMRERAEALGGDVSTTVNGVFTLLVTLPIDCPDAS